MSLTTKSLGGVLSSVAVMMYAEQNGEKYLVN